MEKAPEDVTDAATDNSTEAPTVLSRTPMPVVEPTEMARPRSSFGRVILAAYYPWYDEGVWNRGITSDRPVAPYNSDNSAMIARHIAQARSLGIDGFVSAWLERGDRTDRNLAKLLAASRGTDFRSTVAVQTSLYRSKSQESFANALGYIVATYGNHPNYFKVDGKPVIFFTDMLRVPDGAVDPKAAWRQIRSKVDPNNDQIWIAEGLDPSYLTVFDGLYVIKITHRDYPDDYLKLPRWGNQVRQWATTLAAPKIWVATTMPGWDDTRAADMPDLRDPSPPSRRDREDGLFYRKTFEKACESRPDWIYIASFNEWVEGTQIEPSVSYGERYFDLTREFAGTFKSDSALCW